MGLHLQAAVAQLDGLAGNRQALRQLGEALAQRLRPSHPVALLRRAGMQAMVLLAVHRQHLHMPFECVYGWQEALTIEAVGVQLPGRLVGGGHQHHALRHHQAEQTAEQHRIADVADEQFVETQHAQLAAQLLGQQAQWVGVAGQLELAPVHPAHEMVKVLAPRRHRQAVIETVHQPGLAAPDRPPEVDAGRPLAMQQRRMTALQRLDRTLLRGVSDEAGG